MPGSCRMVGPRTTYRHQKSSRFNPARITPLAGNSAGRREQRCRRSVFRCDEPAIRPRAGIAPSPRSRWGRQIHVFTPFFLAFSSVYFHTFSSGHRAKRRRPKTASARSWISRSAVAHQPNSMLPSSISHACNQCSGNSQIHSVACRKPMLKQLLALR